MGLLTTRGPPAWHPAPKQLRAIAEKLVAEVASPSVQGAIPKELDRELPVAGFALFYSLRQMIASRLTTTLVGIKTVAELNEAFEVYSFINGRQDNECPEMDAVCEKLRESFGEWLGYSWQSPP